MLMVANAMLVFVIMNERDNVKLMQHIHGNPYSGCKGGVRWILTEQKQLADEVGIDGLMVLSQK